MNNKIDKLWNEIKNIDQEKNELFTISEYVSDIISRIVIERNKQGLSQRDLAKITGLKQSAIARLETLQSVPRIDTVAKICYHLNLEFELISKIEKSKYSIIYKLLNISSEKYYDYSTSQYSNSFIQENNNQGYSSCIS